MRCAQVGGGRSAGQHNICAAQKSLGTTCSTLLNYERRHTEHDKAVAARVVTANDGDDESITSSDSEQQDGEESEDGEEPEDSLPDENMATESIKTVDCVRLEKIMHERHARFMPYW
jgi:hypothetical protein